MAISIDVTATIAGIDALGERVNAAVRDIVEDCLNLTQITGAATAPVGLPGNPTSAPPGTLGRSILVEGPVGGDGHWEGKVGPTTVYGRQRELGGDIYPVTAKALHFFEVRPLSYAEGEYGGAEVFTKHVHQFGAHYMLRAYEEVLPSFSVIADEHVAAAIAGA